MQVNFWLQIFYHILATQIVFFGCSVYHIGYTKATRQRCSQLSAAKVCMLPVVAYVAAKLVPGFQFPETSRWGLFRLVRIVSLNKLGTYRKFQWTKRLNMTNLYAGNLSAGGNGFPQQNPAGRPTRLNPSRLDRPDRLNLRTDWTGPTKPYLTSRLAMIGLA